MKMEILPIDSSLDPAVVIGFWAWWTDNGEGPEVVIWFWAWWTDIGEAPEVVIGFWAWWTDIGEAPEVVIGFWAWWTDIGEVAEAVVRAWPWWVSKYDEKMFGLSFRLQQQSKICDLPGGFSGFGVAWPRRADCLVCLGILSSDFFNVWSWTDFL